jgi:hypothetical protein
MSRKRKATNLPPQIAVVGRNVRQIRSSQGNSIPIERKSSPIADNPQGLFFNPRKVRVVFEPPTLERGSHSENALALIASHFKRPNSLGKSMTHRGCHCQRPCDLLTSRFGLPRYILSPNIQIVFETRRVPVQIVMRSFGFAFGLAMAVLRYVLNETGRNEINCGFGLESL